MLINRLRRIFNNWGWLAGMVMFIVVILYFANTNQRLFEESIIENFNEQQYLLITALMAVLEDHIKEAEQNLRIISKEIVRLGNPQKSREILSTIYSNHKDNFIAIDIYASDGKLIERFPADEGRGRNMPSIRSAIINYSGMQEEPFLSRRYLYGQQSTVAMILPFTLSGGERYFTVGLLKIGSFLKLHFSTWEQSNICFILTNHDGDLLSMLNVEHDDVEMLSEGNIRSLDETCLTCHKSNDFADIIRSLETGNTISTVYHLPDGKVINRNTTLLPLYNNVWSWTVCTPYEMVQKAIDKNFSNILIFSLVLLLGLGFISAIAFRSQKRRGILEAEAENLKKIAETSSALAKSEDKFRTLYEESLDVVFFTSREGEFIDLNQSGLELFGYTREEIMSINVREIYANPENRKAFQQTIEKQEFVKDYELDFRHKDGNQIKCLLNASVRRDEVGNIDGYQGIIHDITKRRETENALRQAAELDKKRAIEIQESFKILQESQYATMNLMEDLTQEIVQRKIMAENLRSSQEYLQNLIDSSLDMIIAVDTKRRIQEFNRAAEETFGYKREEVLRKHVDILYADEKQGQKVHQITVKKSRHLQEILNKRKNGEVFPTLLAASTLVNLDGEIIGVMGVSRDITERKQVEAELEQALDEARKANKVKDLFLANMSHEIRTPLNSILGFSEIIEEHFKDQLDEEKREYFHILRNSGERLMNTVHEILDISQIEAGTVPYNPRVVRLATAVEWIYKEFRPAAAAKNLEFTYVNRIDDGAVNADEPSIVKAVSNLVDNAIKYTEEGQINIRLNEQNGKYVLSIGDTGIGIGADYLNQLYEAFSQESTGYTKKYQGLGLGLSIAKSCLDINDVQIAVDSKQGVGTTFSLTFTPADTVIDKPEIKTRPTYTKTEKIVIKVKPVVLLVEDDLHNRKALEVILKDHYETPHAVSVEEAKKQLREYEVDLIILDLSLEGDEDGLDLIAYMKAKDELKNVPVIAVTAHAFTTDRDNVFKAGCNAYMSKPINIKKLLGMISEYC